LWTIGIGLFADTLVNTNVIGLIPRPVIRFFTGTKGISPLAAMIIFVVATGVTAWWQARGKKRVEARREALNDDQRSRLRRIVLVTLVTLILVLPWILGIYLSEVLDVIGIFVLMGLGLNIVVGFAGLLDLGYVAFFAIGAYTMGLLTSTGDLGLGLPFWFALPFSILAAALAGILLGIPVLRMRGDYLAIVTLGFGEIIRGLVVSDLLKPVIGGAQGILRIGRPEILSFVFIRPQHFYYLILVGCLVALFVSTRLRDSRPGRRWMALREDEDVAEAMGINLVNTKLLAFSIGAALGGLAGGIFASRIGSVFPHSFMLLISINVLVLIIVGGIGSLPGVFVGALVLVGLPELLREFSEYRLLMYGALLIVMMLVRPEGLWPSPIRKLELHAEGEEAEHEGIQAEQVADLL
jgi:branched-chain amino acid transport system permease protein